MKTMKLTLILCMFLLKLQHLPAETKRVVQIPVLTPSHARYHANIARALHGLGHQVWLVAPDFLLEKGFTDASNISIIPYQVAQNYHEMILDMLVEAYFLEKAVDERLMLSLAMKLCDDLMLNRELESKIRELQPDLIVLDNTPQMHCVMVFPYKLQVPFAMMGTLYDVRHMRIPYSSAVDALQLQSTCSDDMTFFQRVKSAVFHLLQFVYDPFLPRDIVSVYAPERPFIPSYELTPRAEIWLVDMDHIMDYPRPTLPNVKLIGGTVTDHAKPLPPKLQAFMDSATQGVVIVTFGGSVLGIPKRINHKLFEVFRDLPYKVVFRSNLTSPDPAKVWTSTWLPQNDVLGHPNTKVFLSHCGNNGQYEALFHAVPLLCNPIFADQGYNSERIRKKGFGEVVDIRTITGEELLSRIITVAQEPRYKMAISKASSLFRQQYGTGTKQEAAKWLDHVLQYGGEYMRYPGQKIPLYQFLGLDVLAFVVTLCVMAFVMIYYCVTKMVFCFKRKYKRD